MLKITENQRAFLNQLIVDIGDYLVLPLKEGGPYKTDVKGLQLWFDHLKTSIFSRPWHETRIDWYLFETENFPQEGLSLPDEVPYIPKYTADRKFTFLYWYLVKVKGYELCVLGESFSAQPRETMHLGPPPRGGSFSALYIKVS